MEQRPIGRKLTAMRKKKKITIDELSEKTGLPSAHLKKIEEGKGFAPVGDILRIARALTVDPGELLPAGGERAKELEKRRVSDFRKREEAYQYEVLTPRAVKDHLRAFRVLIPPRSVHPGTNYQHEGEEFVYTLKGEVVIQVGRKRHRLKKDQSLHFNSGIRHTLKNPGNVTTELIVTIYTP
ncbi:MAG: helix-turn-helix transcriptional regulator [Spirochaetes bacterium]|nr:helix-turn-helix transcriptional regulator [Spirochaetota bacterium]